MGLSIDLDVSVSSKDACATVEVHDFFAILLLNLGALPKTDLEKSMIATWYTG